MVTPQFARLVPVQQVSSRLWSSLRGACISSYKNNLLGTAKAAAYSGLLAFFPILTSIAALLLQANAEAVWRRLSGLLEEVIPPGTETLILNNFNNLVSGGQRPVSLLVVAVLFSLWAGSGLTMSLMQGFQAAHRLPNTRGFWRQRTIAILLVLASAVPAISASALLVFGDRTEDLVLNLVTFVTPNPEGRLWVVTAGRVARYLTALAGLVLATSLLYYYGPRWPRSWREVLPGAFLATGLWLIATTLFGWYVRNIANYNVMYGGIGAGIALLVWLYVLSVILLFGCEFNAERRRNVRVHEMIGL